MAFKDTWKDKVDNVDDVSADDINSIAQEAIRLDADKVDKVEGKGLSTNDFTNAYKKKLDGIDDDGNVQIVDQAYDPKSENAQSGKAVAEAIEETIGDIETALDSIIDIQNELIGGESV